MSSGSSEGTQRAAPGVSGRAARPLSLEQPDSTLTQAFGGHDWTVQRPQSDGLWNNNVHWISPANANTFQELLMVLGDAGFNQVLDKVGNHFGHDKLGIYQLSFHGVSEAAAEGGFFHVDFSDTGNKAWNIIVPLVLANETGPELGIVHEAVSKDDTEKLGLYRYERDVAVILGDDVEHVTNQCAYKGNNMRMIIVIYVAEVVDNGNDGADDDSNVDAVLSSYFGLQYPPRGDAEVLRSLVHWKGGDDGADDGNNVRLPTH